MKGLHKALLALLVVGVLSTAPTALAGGTNHGKNHGKKDGKTTICHATGSQTNPYVRIRVSNNALDAHRRHQDGRDIIPAPTNGCPNGDKDDGKNDDCKKDDEHGDNGEHGEKAEHGEKDDAGKKDDDHGKEDDDHGKKGGPN